MADASLMPGEAYGAPGDPTAISMDQGSGPTMEARQAGYANWYWAARGILDGVDNQLRQQQPIAGAGVTVGMSPYGEVYVQGRGVNAATGQPTTTNTAVINPLLLVLAFIGYKLLVK